MTKDEIQARIIELQGILKQVENQYVKILGMIEEQTFQLSKIEQTKIEQKEREEEEKMAANEDSSDPAAV